MSNGALKRGFCARCKCTVGTYPNGLTTVPYVSIPTTDPRGLPGRFHFCEKCQTKPEIAALIEHAGRI